MSSEMATAGRMLRVRQWSGRTEIREAMAAYVFVLPQVLGLVGFIGVPLVVSLYYSFTKWDLISPAPTWIGLANWNYLLHDPRVPKVLWNTVRFILSGTSSFLVLALLMALLLNRQVKGVSFFRALFVLPFVLSAIGVAAMWRWALNGESGPIEQAFALFHLNSPQWLFDPTWTMYAIAMVTTWQALGYGMTVFLAALQDIPQELYDAAKVDGANGWRTFVHITFPQLSPVTFFLIVTSLIAAFQLFDPVVGLTTDGFGGTASAGGPQDSTRTIVLYLYNQMFQYSERLSGLGYASTIAWMLALIIFLVTAIQWLLARRWVFYAGAPR